MLTLPARVRRRPAYRTFDVRVARVERLSPHFARVTFAGDELELFGGLGFDHRIKVVFPHDEHGFAHFPEGDDWYPAWRELPDGLRNAFRTYTIRRQRIELREVDVDFALHGTCGPASRWATGARPGDRVLLIGPDARSDEAVGGIDWRPGTVSEVLIAGDETAVPAVGAILEHLPADARGHVFLEVPSRADVLELRAPAGIRIAWLPRDEVEADAAHGELLVNAVTNHARARATVVASGFGVLSSSLLERQEALEAAERTDTEAVPVWDVPAGRSLDGDAYAWVAGEASAVKAIRRFLVRDLGMDRRRVAFMGYWRQGRAEIE